MKIFLVEDSKAVRERLLAMIAEIGGMEVVGQSDNASDAVNGILRSQPDVVLLDVTLAEGSGIEVMSRSKAHRADIRVIMMTSHPYAQYREQCLAAGATYFFNKNHEFQEIRKALEWMKLEQQA